MSAAVHREESPELLSLPGVRRFGDTGPERRLPRHRTRGGTAGDHDGATTITGGGGPRNGGGLGHITEPRSKSNWPTPPTQRSGGAEKFPKTCRSREIRRQGGKEYADHNDTKRSYTTKKKKRKKATTKIILPIIFYTLSGTKDHA